MNYIEIQPNVRLSVFIFVERVVNFLSSEAAASTMALVKLSPASLKSAFLDSHCAAMDRNSDLNPGRP